MVCSQTIRNTPFYTVAGALLAVTGRAGRRVNKAVSVTSQGATCDIPVSHIQSRLTCCRRQSCSPLGREPSAWWGAWLCFVISAEQSFHRKDRLPGLRERACRKSCSDFRSDRYVRPDRLTEQFREFPWWKQSFLYEILSRSKHLIRHSGTLPGPAQTMRGNRAARLLRSQCSQRHDADFVTARLPPPHGSYLM